MLKSPEPEARRLVCAQCGRTSDDQARGWQAVVLSKDEEWPLQEDEVEAFCPECVAREFGEA
jgi:hypothetical protein